MHDLKVYEMHRHKGIAKVFMHMFYGGISYQTHGLKVFSQMHGLKGIVKCSCTCFMKAFHVKHVALKVLVKGPFLLRAVHLRRSARNPSGMVFSLFRPVHLIFASVNHAT
jgi:hypothetical protein